MPAQVCTGGLPNWEGLTLAELLGSHCVLAQTVVVVVVHSSCKVLFQLAEPILQEVYGVSKGAFSHLLSVRHWAVRSWTSSNSSFSF